MRPDDLKPLFESARRVPPPPVPEGFADHVMRSLNAAPVPLSLSSQLAEFFPRWATAACLVLILAVSADYWASDGSLSDMAAEAVLMAPGVPLSF